MPPKTSKKKTDDIPNGDDIGDIDVGGLSKEGRLIVEAITKRFEDLQTLLLNQLSEKECTIHQLSSEVDLLKSKVDKLEEQIDDADAYERRDTILISGPDLPVSTPGENCSQLICSVAKDKLKLEISPSDISTAHRFGKKPVTQAPDRRSILVKLCRRDLKHDLRYACKQLKPKLYVNESLTPMRSTIMYALRQAKRKFPSVVSGCSSFDGKVCAWLKTSDSATMGGRDSRVTVNTRHRLEELCDKSLGCQLTDLIERWPH